MLGMIPFVAAMLTFGVVLTLASERFAFAVSRIMEAAFDGVEYRLALRARRHAARLKARRREEQRAGRLREATYSH